MNLLPLIALLIGRGGKVPLMLQRFTQQARLAAVRLAEAVKVNALRPEGTHPLPGQQTNQQRKGEQADSYRAGVNHRQRSFWRITFMPAPPADCIADAAADGSALQWC